METIRSPRSRGLQNVQRLSRIYAQHKAAKPPVSAHDAPEVLSLHRKFRIQKDRLIAWGFEWSDTSDSEQGNIDETLARAGLTELVSSIMNNIQHINEEIEQLGSEVVYTPGVYRPDTKTPQPRRPRTSAWTKEEIAQYEDLVKDYTKAIDLLCDLPRSRRPAQDPGEKDTSYFSDKGQASWQIQPSDHWSADLTLIEHSLFKLDISSLEIPQESPPSYDDMGAVRSTRVFGHLRHSHITFDSHNNQRESLPQPILIEYATFDSLYKENNIPLPMLRLEQLYMYLQSRQASTEKSLTQLLGYFEDPHQPRYGLVFALPEEIAANISAMPRNHNSVPYTSLLDLLQTSSRLHAQPHASTAMVVPPLEERFRLAHELVCGMSFMHERSYPHRDFSSNSITLLPKPQLPQSNSQTPQYDLRRPMLGSFDLFSEYTIDPKPFQIHQNLYRHPDDPVVRGTAASEDYEPRFDLYSLGLVLLEIGLWSPVADTFKDKYNLAAFKTRIEKIWVRKLAGKCGSVYMRAVQDCLAAASNPANNADKLKHVYGRLKLRLARCCIVDDSDLEEVPDTAPLPEHRASEVGNTLPEYTLPSVQQQQKADVQSPNVYWEKPLPESVEQYWQSELAEAVGDIVDQAIKNSKESMMLGLAYAGPNEATAKLSILVGCESINCVSEALQRHLHVDRSVFDVVVHSGSVAWSKASRNDAADVRRSAGPGHEAKNPQHQLKPVCGASIGAWRNSEHMPPVTFGGVIQVDGERFGMSVHHMLEDVEEGEEETRNIVRSAGHRSKPTTSPSTSIDHNKPPLPPRTQSSPSTSALENTLAHLTLRTTPLPLEEGDTPGVTSHTERITITQPALDDVMDKDDFFPVVEDMDEDHLDSHSFGTVYASSGLRRTTHQGLKQEVDWVLINIDKNRARAGCNVMLGGKKYMLPSSGVQSPLASGAQDIDFTPLAIAPTSTLKTLPVHIIGRTSGLSSGKIAPTLVQIRFPGRSKRSWAWVVTGGIGLPGDSGAWLVDNKLGRVCGHVLGYVQAHGIAIFSPMEMMLEDIRATLGAGEVGLAGTEGVNFGTAAEGTGLPHSAAAAAMRTAATVQSEAGATERDLQRSPVLSSRPISFLPGMASRSSVGDSRNVMEMGHLGKRVAAQFLSSGGGGLAQMAGAMPRLSSQGRRMLLGQEAGG